MVMNPMVDGRIRKKSHNMKHQVWNKKAHEVPMLGSRTSKKDLSDKLARCCK